MWSILLYSFFLPFSIARDRTIDNDDSVVFLGKISLRHLRCNGKPLRFDPEVKKTTHTFTIDDIEGTNNDKVYTMMIENIGNCSSDCTNYICQGTCSRWLGSNNKLCCPGYTVQCREQDGCDYTINALTEHSSKISFQISKQCRSKLYCPENIPGCPKKGKTFIGKTYTYVLNEENIHCDQLDLPAETFYYPIRFHLETPAESSCDGTCVSNYCLSGQQAAQCQSWILFNNQRYCCPEKNVFVCHSKDDCKIGWGSLKKRQMNLIAEFANCDDSLPLENACNISVLPKKCGEIVPFEWNIDNQNERKACILNIENSYLENYQIHIESLEVNNRDACSRKCNSQHLCEGYCRSYFQNETCTGIGCFQNCCSTIIQCNSFKCSYELQLDNYGENYIKGKIEIADCPPPLPEGCRNYLPEIACENEQMTYSYEIHRNCLFNMKPYHVAEILEFDNACNGSCQNGVCVGNDDVERCLSWILIEGETICCPNVTLTCFADDLCFYELGTNNASHFHTFTLAMKQKCDPVQNVVAFSPEFHFEECKTELPNCWQKVENFINFHREKMNTCRMNLTTDEGYFSIRITEDACFDSCINGICQEGNCESWIADNGRKLCCANNTARCYSKECYFDAFTNTQGIHVLEYEIIKDECLLKECGILPTVDCESSNNITYKFSSSGPCIATLESDSNHTDIIISNNTNLCIGTCVDKVCKGTCQSWISTGKNEICCPGSSLSCSGNHCKYEVNSKDWKATEIDVVLRKQCPKKCEENLRKEEESQSQEIHEYCDIAIPEPSCKNASLMTIKKNVIISRKSCDLFFKKSFPHQPILLQISSISQHGCSTDCVNNHCASNCTYWIASGKNKICCPGEYHICTTADCIYEIGTRKQTSESFSFNLEISKECSTFEDKCKIFKEPSCDNPINDTVLIENRLNKECFLTVKSEAAAQPIKVLIAEGDNGCTGSCLSNGLCEGECYAWIGEKDNKICCPGASVVCYTPECMFRMKNERINDVTNFNVTVGKLGCEKNEEKLSCVDNSYLCEDLKKLGFCGNRCISPTLVERTCAKTCNTCGKEKRCMHNKCFDKLTSCSKLKSDGICRTNVLKAIVDCPKTCGFC